MTQAHHLPIHLITYLLFLGSLLFVKRKNGIRLFSENGPVGDPAMLIHLHVCGFLLFALTPYCLFHQSMREIVLGNTTVSFVQVCVIAILVTIAIVIAPMLAQKQYEKVHDNSGPPFTKSFLAVYFFFRIMFLAAYETWFRGYLLTDSMSWGLALAILINITAYTVLHIVNGKNEMVACVPFGLLLCLLSVWTNAAWPAILIHTAFTVSFEIHLVKKIIKPSTLIV
jgi:hypothetical protein